MKSYKAFYTCLTALASFAAVAENIDTAGTLTNAVPPVDYRITGAGAAGSMISLGADAVTIGSLTQVQSADTATVRILGEQSLTLSSAKVEDAASPLVLGHSIGAGKLLGPGSDAKVMFEPAGSDSLLRVNALASLGSREVLKAGLGDLVFAGGFSGAVKQSEGNVRYFDPYSGACVTVKGSDVVYDVRAGSEASADFPTAYDTGDTLRNEALITSEDTVPVTSLQVNGGAVARARDVSFRQPAYDTYEFPEPAGVVGLGSTGSLTLEHCSWIGNFALGGGDEDYARGALRLTDGTVFTNYSAATGRYLLGRSGYAYLEVAGSEYHALGGWAGGCDGQLNLVVTNSLFAHSASEVRPSPLKLGGSESMTHLYVGTSGVFSAANTGADVEIPMVAATNVDTVVVTATDGGCIDFGENRVITLGANLGYGSKGVKCVFNLNRGGVIRAAALRKAADSGKGEVSVNFNGGIWELTGELLGDASAPFDFPLYAYEGGVGISVPYGCQATLGEQSPVLAPSGKGVVGVDVSVLEDKIFVGPPTLSINGSGTGASGVLQWDAATRRVTGYEFTSPGRDYDSASASAHYAGQTYTLSMTATCRVENVSGGLTKYGTGTLILGTTNTFTGPLVARSGVVILAVENAVPPEAGLRLEGGIVDLYNLSVQFADYGGNGSGSVRNGKAIITALKCDVPAAIAREAAGAVEKLDMRYAEFSSGALLKLVNFEDDSILDRSREYVLYEIIGTVPDNFPLTDPATYENGLDASWGISVEGNQVVLRYFDGTLLMFY